MHACAEDSLHLSDRYQCLNGPCREIISSANCQITIPEVDRLIYRACKRSSQHPTPGIPRRHFSFQFTATIMAHASYETGTSCALPYWGTGDEELSKWFSWLAQGEDLPSQELSRQSSHAQCHISSSSWLQTLFRKRSTDQGPMTPWLPPPHPPFFLRSTPLLTLVRLSIVAMMAWRTTCELQET